MGKLTDLLAEPPPPAYEKVAKYRTHGTLPGGLDASLWVNILAKVVAGRKNDKEERAVGFAHLHRDVRFVCKDLYLVSMHILRSHYIPRYLSRIRAPYTSEAYHSGEMLPFTSSSAPSTSRQTLSYVSPPSFWEAPQRSGNGAGRETRVFDLFIAACVREDVESFESSLLDSTLGEDGQGESDLFTVHQPQSRLEDLLIIQGRRHGLVLPDAEEDWYEDVKGNLGYEVDGKQKSASVKAHRNALAAEEFAIELRGRTAVLRVRSRQSSSRAFRTFLEVPRTRQESLEKICVRLMTALRDHR